MIRLQEIYHDMDARRPVRIETGRQNIATIRQLVHWAKENNKTNMLNVYYDMLAENVHKYFHNQSKGDLRFYVVTSELHGSMDFKAEQVDETVNGCLAGYRFTRRS